MYLYNILKFNIQDAKETHHSTLATTTSKKQLHVLGPIYEGTHYE